VVVVVVGVRMKVRVWSWWVDWGFWM